jgi:tetratricopeptide (TPR) repeat protein
VSLLMDALKKAELAKRQAQAGSVRAAGGRTGAELELAPLEGSTANPPAGMQLDELHLEVLDDQFETPIASKFRHDLPRRAGEAAAAAAPAADERAAARNVFEAKQNKGTGKLFIVVVAALTLVAVAVIGIYFWLQLAQPGSTLLAPGAQTAAARPPASTPVKPIASAPTAALAPTETKTQPDARPTRPRAKVSAPPLPSADGEAPIRITTASLQVNPVLARAYDAFAAGDMATAERDYEQVLQGDAKNTDALLGLAAVDLRRGHAAKAEDRLLRTLEADPKNALAQAGLISLHNQTDPVQAESHLQTLIAAQPDLPPLHFVLGNLYAREGRWNEAQRAYFKAYSGDTDNPDYLFNLAISLDRIRQPKLAAQYYNQALAAAASRQASFDRAQVTARLQELQQ